MQWGPGIVYSRLLRFHAGPGTGAPNGEIECDLCETWEMVEPTLYRFRLRAGVKWQDIPPVNGRALTSSDVTYSLGRQATPGWPNAALLSTMSTVESPEPRTVTVRLRNPDAETLSRLADGHTRIVAREAVEVAGNLLAGPTIGTGPWILTEWNRSVARYRANPDYYEHGAPAADFLAVHTIQSTEVRTSALRTRTLDVAVTDAASLREATARFPELKWARSLEPGTGVEVALNTRVPPFDSIGTRRAVLLALDPRRDAAAIWLDGATATSGLPVPSVDWLLPAGEAARYFGDPARAGELLRQAGSDGAVFEITVGEFGIQYVDQATRIAEDLRAVGLKPTVRRVSTRTYGDEAWFGGKYQMLIGAQPPVTSLTEFLMGIHHSRGPWNTTGFSSPEIDRMIEAQAVAHEPEERRALIVEIQRQALSGAHRFSPATAYLHWAWWPHVQDFVPNTYRGESHFLARTWLSEP